MYPQNAFFLGFLLYRTKQNRLRIEIIFSALYRQTCYAVNVLYYAVTRLDTDSTAPGKRVAVGGFAQPERKKADTHSLIAFYILSLFIE